MNGAGNYSVQPDVLRDFAETLKSQAMAIQRLQDTLNDISGSAGTMNLFGAFPEAASLAHVHLNALMNVRKLIEQVETLYWFGDEVASQAAAGYQTTDAAGRDGLSRFTIDDGSLVGRLS
ncbi:MAG: hypothetical protein RI885_2645 [Actinomycetota bacterium]|jgi:hypothetical protein